MRVDVEALKSRGASLFSAFTIGQRITLALAGIGVVVGLLFLTSSGGTTEWAPLYSNLEADDAMGITTELDTLGVPYKLEHAGTTVSVHRDDVYQTRLDLSAKGLPKLGAPGYDLLDEQGITTSEFRQRIDYQRAMEGELAKTIGALDAVESATVHLVMPKDDLFSGDDVHPSASVLVSARQKLAATQVQAIVHLVASSVEGLVPEQVTVADDAGNVLSAPGGAGADAAAGELQVTRKLAYESTIESAIVELLEPITGAGGTQVQVSADLDFDTRERVSETFGDPETAPVVSESTSTETYTGSGGQLVGGVLGPENVPVDGQGGDTDYERGDAQRTYAVDKVTEQVKAAPGGIERLSVAVVVDEAAGVDTQEIEQLVTAGAGLVLARGDTIEVTAMSFPDVDVAADDVEGTSSSPGDEDVVGGLLRTGGTVVLVLVVLLLAYRSAKRSSLAKYPVAIPLPAAEPAAELPAGVADKELDELAELAAAHDLLELRASDPPAHLVLQSQIGELIDRQPEEVASVLRTWLADRRS